MDKKYISTIVVTALISCLATNTVRDMMFVKDNGKFVRKVNTVMKTINDNYLFDYDTDKIADYASYAMTAALEEPYSSYYDAETFSSYLNKVSSSYIGIGTSMVANSQTNEINIVGVYENSPADKGGIIPGDKIIALNGETANATNFSEIAQKMRGGGEDTGVGTTLTLTIVRDGKNMDITMAREFINKVTVTGKMLDDKTAYIRIEEFTTKNTDDENAKDTYDEFMEKMSLLRDEGMTKLVIDVRNNPGGALNVALKIADEFLPQCTMAYTMNKDGEKYRYNSTSDMNDMPIAVLVNENSASASEAFAGAIQSQKRAEIIGTTTYGKGIVQSVIPFSDGSGISLTTSKYYTEDGVEIHKNGITPDTAVELKTDKNILTLTMEEDTQLKTAFEKLNK